MWGVGILSNAKKKKKRIYFPSTSSFSSIALENNRVNNPFSATTTDKHSPRDINKFRPKTVHVLNHDQKWNSLLVM